MPTLDSHFALVVGIDDYPQHNSLSGAANDAGAFVEWLTNTDTGGGLPAENIELIRSTAEPPTPLQYQIDFALDRLLESAKTATGTPRLYFYFSGHGLGQKVDDAAMCLSVWSLRLRGAALSSQEYANYTHQSGVFRELFFFLDCCRNVVEGAAGKGPMLAPLNGKGVGGVRRLVAFASEYGDNAFEGWMGGNRRGVFTTALLEALWGAASKDGLGVTPEDLKKYLEVELPRLATLAKIEQIPDVYSNFPASKPPRLGLGSRPSSVTIEFTPGRAGPVVLFDGDLDQVKRGSADSGPWTLVLEKGLYELVDESCSERHTFRYDGRTGKTNVRF